MEDWMMSNYKKTAKDKAFDEKLSRQRSIISQMENVIQKQNILIDNLRLHNNVLVEKNTKLSKRNDELVELLKVPRKDLDALIIQTKKTTDIREFFNMMNAVSREHYLF